MKLSSYTYIRTLLTLIMFIGLLSVTALYPLFVPVRAAYVDNDANSFIYYKSKIQSSLQDLEREYRLNNSVTDSTLSNIKNLVQESYQRLPDGGDTGAKNEWLKKSADLYLDLALKNKASSIHIQNAAAQVSSFVSEAQISEMVASIDANPTSGNAPLVSSFSAKAKDPSGINIPDKNYTWWMKEAGWYRRELWKGSSFTYTFAKEWNYQIFLDVISESRNKKGNPDVTPISISQDIEVKPRLGNIILLINGVNVSNIDTLKVSPTLAKIGLLFDASASRAVSNGTIIKTKWDFGNGNTQEYDGAPVLEKQLYVNPEMYKVSINITTNQGQTFNKQIQLLVRDPAAVISIDKETWYIGEELSMSAKSYLSNVTNVEYTWEIQDVESGKKTLASKKWSALSYKFMNVWQYLITLTTRSPNGNVDTDSRIIIIESRSPVINLDTPRFVTSERPNTLIFDASKSYDPDTNNAKWLTYAWMIDGKKEELSEIQKDGALWVYTFTEKWAHSVSLTVSNAYGKVSTVDKNFDVSSTLTVGMNITPRATPIGNVVSFQARSPQARFYEWNLGDGSPTINGTTDFVQNNYKKTWVYAATLTVKNSDGSEENRITRKIYITDTDKPFALIEIKNSSTSVIEDPAACENSEWAFVINRAENTTIEWGNSINIDGNSAGLSYTWRYMDKVKTGPSISEKFTELGCFPIELTVKNDKTGASHISTRYIEIKNIKPKVTSVTASIDATKKDTQKIIANVIANGARDEDGVIRSYIWFYTTESDPERQNVRITQSPSTNFVLPNVTEKYYFWVIAEDNDGARYDSTEIKSDQTPLLVANEDANINMPLISLSIVNFKKERWFFFPDETIEFSASAKNILGTDITDKSEYYWDFDGDSRIDQKTTTPQTSYKYKKSWKYNMKIKVVNNGISNTKYQVIYVKNELKARVIWHRMGDMVYFLNSSIGSYDTAKWILGSVESTNLYGTSIPKVMIASSGSLGTLTVKSWANEISTVEISISDIQDQEKSASGITLQSYPAIEWNTIKVLSPGDKILLSMHGNSGNEYIIDSDIKIDSDLDAVWDNDKDNKDTPSYKDGSVFSIGNLSDVKNRNREMKLTIIGDDGKVIATKTIQVIFDYIPDITNDKAREITGSGWESFSSTDKANLEKLQAKIRTFSSEDRVVYTQYYNTLIENWGDLHDRTEWLLLIQKEVIDSQSFDDTMKKDLSDIIDIILVGDAQSTNEISVASRVIEWLISPTNSNRAYIIERLEQIKSHPAKLAENKILGKEILTKIQEDTSISTENKILIKSQLLTIVNGWQESIPESDTKKLTEESVTWSGILWFIWGTVKIFLIIIGIIIGLFLLGYIVYRLSRKSGDMWFQDFLIDSIAHHKSGSTKNTSPTPLIKKDIQDPLSIPSIVTPLETKNGANDPLASLGKYPKTELGEIPSEKPPEATMIEVSPNLTPEETHTIPDWLKPVKDDSEAIVIKSSSLDDPLLSDPLDSSQSPLDILEKSDEGILPSPSEDIQENPLISAINAEASLSPLEIDLSKSTISESWTEITRGTTLPVPRVWDTSSPESELIPEWLSPPMDDTKDVAVDPPSGKEIDNENLPPVIPPPSPDADLPDWLKNSMEDGVSTSKESSSSSERWEPKSSTKPKKKKEKTSNKIGNMEKEETIKTPKKDTIPWWDDIPDWLK
jgi:PKD repeat protein